MWGHMVWMALRYLDERRITAITLSQWIKVFPSFKMTALRIPGTEGNILSESRQIIVTDETLTSGRKVRR